MEDLRHGRIGTLRSGLDLGRNRSALLFEQRCRVARHGQDQNVKRRKDHGSHRSDPGRWIREEKMSASPKMDFFEVGDKTSLICTDAKVGEIVRTTLHDLDFKFHSADNAEIATERIRYTLYDIIIIQDDFAGGDLKANSVLNYLSSLAMAQRRFSMVVLIGSTFKTLDALQAFAYSVQLVVNTMDLANLGAILKKSWAEFDVLYRVYKSVTVAMRES